MEIVTKIAPIALALIMLGLGLGLTGRDFLRVINNPKDFVIGFVCQLFLLPIVAYILILILNLPIEIALGIMIIAHQKRGIKAAIVNAGKELPMLSVMDAVKEKLIVPVLIGDQGEIKKIAEELKFDISDYEIVHEPIENNTAKVAAKLAGDGDVKILSLIHI